MNRPCGPGPARSPWLALVLFGLAGCADSVPPASTPLVAQEPLSTERFAALVERISEPGGYFDTDNLISNETGYLNVMDALERLGVQGGAYVGVGPDQNFSYLAVLRPEIVFMTDVRRDNMLHHLLLKALMSRAPTRIEFLAGLHGVEPPPDAASWRDRSIDDIVELAATIDGYGVPLSEEDHATIRRFHRTFVGAGMSLRFTSLGRAPRPYYPTYRQLVLETDVDGDQASYLARHESYDTVRRLQLANRIVPVVGDMSGPSALRAMGEVMRELGLELSAFYTSNVEFYLWQNRTFDRWIANLASLPISDEAVVIRSYFPNFGGGHPSAVPGYYSTQTLQPVSTLLDASFDSYWDVVTRGVIELGLP